MRSTDRIPYFAGDRVETKKCQVKLNTKNINKRSIPFVKSNVKEITPGMNDKTTPFFKLNFGAHLRCIFTTVPFFETYPQWKICYYRYTLFICAAHNVLGTFNCVNLAPITSLHRLG